MRWRDLSLRWKLLLSLSGLVAVVTGSLLAITTRHVARTYESIFAQSFSREIEIFEQTRAQRLEQAQRSCEALTRQVRFVASFNEEEVDATNLYTVVRNEIEGPGNKAHEISRAQFFRLVNVEGKILLPPDERAGFTEGEVAKELTAKIDAAVGDTGITNTMARYISLPMAHGRALYEILLLPVVDVAEDEVVGAIVIGFEARLPGQERVSSGVLSGIWHEGHLFSANIPSNVAAILLQTVRGEALTAQGTLRGEGDSFRIFVSPLKGMAASTDSKQISLYSRREELATHAQLRRSVIALGSIGVITGICLSLLLAHSLSSPVAELSTATRQIQEGRLETRVQPRGNDEIGRLALSFNDMAAGLELKEKYRSVLEIVADKSVAEELMSGKISLGGEARSISALFCDIRGFTALTENMPPGEVIQMLNDHFAPLTRIVYENNGIVDKFVGDLIMAVFGAPRHDDQHAAHAVKCARDMIAARAEMNKTSRHKIEMGIGVSSGVAVAGTMGSEARMSYTVLGERVNLAARLCSQAGRMEIVIDETTRAAVADSVPLTATEPVKLKGFAAPVQTYKVSL